MKHLFLLPLFLLCNTQIQATEKSVCELRACKQKNLASVMKFHKQLPHDAEEVEGEERDNEDEKEEQEEQNSEEWLEDDRNKRKKTKRKLKNKHTCKKHFQ